MKVYVLTVFGMLCNTEVQLFHSRDEAIGYIKEQWDEMNKKQTLYITEICGSNNVENVPYSEYEFSDVGIWKTEDCYSQDIEWEIHEKEF